MGKSTISIYFYGHWRGLHHLPDTLSRYCFSLLDARFLGWSTDRAVCFEDFFVVSKMRKTIPY